METSSEYRVDLPYFGSFDYIWTEVEPGQETPKVTLKGFASRLGLVCDAEAALHRQFPSSPIDNQIELLQPSGEDDRIRFAAMSAILQLPQFHRTPRQSRLSVHVIVKDGMLHLFGTVDNDSQSVLVVDCCLAVRGVAGVKDNLQVAR